MCRFLAGLAAVLALSVGSNCSAQVPGTPEQLDQIAKLSAEQFDQAKDTFKESREWLKDPKHVLSVETVKREAVVKLVEDLYGAGAVRVYFTAVEKEGDKEKAPALMAVIGGKPEARAKAFQLVNDFTKNLAVALGKPELAEVLKMPDAGQPVLTVAL